MSHVPQVSLVKSKFCSPANTVFPSSQPRPPKPHLVRLNLHHLNFMPLADPGGHQEPVSAMGTEGSVDGDMSTQEPPATGRQEAQKPSKPGGKYYSALKWKY